MFVDQYAILSSTVLSKTILSYIRLTAYAIVLQWQYQGKI